MQSSIYYRNQLEKDIIAYILNHDNYHEVCNILKPINFSDPFYRDVYAAISGLPPTKSCTIHEVAFALKHLLPQQSLKEVVNRLSECAHSYSVLFKVKLGALQLLEFDLREKLIYMLNDFRKDAFENDAQFIDEISELLEDHTNAFDIINLIHSFPKLLIGSGVSKPLADELRKFSSQVSERCLIASNNAVADRLVDRLFEIPIYLHHPNAKRAAKHLAGLITEIWRTPKLSDIQLNKILNIQL